MVSELTITLLAWWKMRPKQCIIESLCISIKMVDMKNKIASLMDAKIQRLALHYLESNGTIFVVMWQVKVREMNSSNKKFLSNFDILKRTLVNKVQTEPNSN